MTDFDKWQIAEARCADLQARCERLLGALMLVTFPRNGDYGGPLVTVTARYEDGSEIGRGHSENREASAALQHTTAETGDG